MQCEHIGRVLLRINPTRFIIATRNSAKYICINVQWLISALHTESVSSDFMSMFVNQCMYDSELTVWIV